ncbi:MAG: flavin reductase family protein [Nocardioides sp.]|uniref:flavin reductase family protein n=1 Tax=Nocardioides sp. TaxID=35761 RepID=UPI0039E26A34
MTPAHEADAATLRAVFAGFPSGVAAVGAVVEGTAHVLVVSSFTVGVSQDPPLVLFAVQRTSSTWPDLRRAPVLGVSVLGVGHELAARQLAGHDKAARLAGVDHQVTPSGAVLLEESPVWLECTVEHEYPAGDHDIVVLRVSSLASSPDHDPLVWHRSRFASLAD